MKKTSIKDTRKRNLAIENAHSRLPLVEKHDLIKYTSVIKMLEIGLSLDYADLPFVSDRLNDLEKELFNQNPVIGARVLISAYKAEETAAELYPSGAALNDGNGDAYRHMYWNFLMASDADVGSSWADRWGTAHENGNPKNDSLRKTMDLHNNMRGRQMAEARVDDDPRALRAVVRSGSCRIIVDGKLVRSNDVGEAF